VIWALKTFVIWAVNRHLPILHTSALTWLTNCSYPPTSGLHSEDRTQVGCVNNELCRCVCVCVCVGACNAILLHSVLICHCMLLMCRAMNDWHAYVSPPKWPVLCQNDLYCVKMTCIVSKWPVLCQNDLCYVGWSVKLYSLTHLLSCLFKQLTCAPEYSNETRVLNEITN